MLIDIEVILVKLDGRGQPQDIECSWQGRPNISVEEQDRIEGCRRFVIYTLLHSGGQLVLLNPFKDETLAYLIFTEPEVVLDVSNTLASVPSSFQNPSWNALYGGSAKRDARVYDYRVVPSLDVPCQSKVVVVVELGEAISDYFRPGDLSVFVSRNEVAN